MKSGIYFYGVILLQNIQMNENFLAGKLSSIGKGDKNSICHRTEKSSLQISLPLLATVARHIHSHTFLA